jgi:hypothetical protein
MRCATIDNAWSRIHGDTVSCAKNFTARNTLSLKYVARIDARNVQSQKNTTKHTKNICVSIVGKSVIPLTTKNKHTLY